ncbi:MAG: ATP-binding cassette domain-containing protein [Peptostreptococcaceae bacterium]|nr:ATP-binding cassette domain-containing protein [Peptostreptococcaceae bacterium]
MIELKDLTKKYADKTVVSRLSFQIHTGKVTGFLDPNGAGKSTTIRMILHLTLPTSGSVTVDGQEFRKLRTPLTKIGAMVDAAVIDPRLTPKQVSGDFDHRLRARRGKSGKTALLCRPERSLQQKLPC